MRKAHLGLVLVAALVAVITPFWQRAQQRAERGEAVRSLRSVATALELYSTDNTGIYPSELGQLVPKYLKELPPVVAPGACSYRASA